MTTSVRLPIQLDRTKGKGQTILVYKAIYQAIFLDRDGVINRERADYVKSWTEFTFLPGVLPALARLSTLACPILVISNQSAVGRGLMTLETVQRIHHRLAHCVAIAGGRIDGFYVCPHHPQARCTCRKPMPGLLLKAAEEHRLDLAHCILIGDSSTDLQAAEAAGCSCILVQSGRQAPQLQAIYGRHSNVCLLPDLAVAVANILAHASTSAVSIVAEDRQSTEMVNHGNH